MPKSHYDILGVEESADADSIRKAYRKLARQLHPDVNTRANAADRMSAVNEAYEVLSDRGRREHYDAERRTGLNDAPAPTASATTAYTKHHLSIVDLPSPPYSIDFSPQRDELAIGCFDNSVRFASGKTGNSLADVQLEGGAITSLRWVGRTRLIAAGVSEHIVSIWRLRDRKLEGSISKRADWVSPLAIDSKGAFVVLGSVHRRISCVDTQSGKIIFDKKAHEDSVSAIAISQDGEIIASGGNDHKVMLWSRAGALRAQIGPLRAAIAPMAFAHDGSQLAVSLIDHGIRVFDLSTGALRTTLWGHQKPVESLAFHPSGSILASAARDGSTRLWDPISGKPLDVLAGHSGPVKCVSFSPSGLFLASGGLDRAVSIWRVTA